MLTCVVVLFWLTASEILQWHRSALLKRLKRKMFCYLVMFDPKVDVFISRDVESIIWKREVDAVEEWLKSNYTFHVMRDHKFHGSVILTGKCSTYFDSLLLKF